MSDASDMEEVLAGFDRARDEYEEAVRRAPDEALRYRPEGEDYALGGLVVHVARVLRDYAAVLDAIRAADWQPLQAPSSEPSPEEAALIREGFSGDTRSAVLEQMRSAHSTILDAVRACGRDAFRRKADVTYSGSNQPYPTSPA